MCTTAVGSPLTPVAPSSGEEAPAALFRPQTRSWRACAYRSCSSSSSPSPSEDELPPSYAPRLASCAAPSASAADISSRSCRTFSDGGASRPPTLTVPRALQMAHRTTYSPVDSNACVIDCPCVFGSYDFVNASHTSRCAVAASSITQRTTSPGATKSLGGSKPDLLTLTMRPPPRVIGASPAPPRSRRERAEGARKRS